LPAAVTIASGGTVTVTIEVTAISTGTYTNTLTVLVPAATINLGATHERRWLARWPTWSTSAPSKLVGSVTVAQGLTTSFTLVVSNAGPAHADRQPQRQHPGALQHHAGAGGQRGQRQRQHRQLQRLGQRRVCRQRSRSPRAAR
jgi:hypothetical protein